MNYLELVGPSLLRHTPELLGWLVGVILALRMLRRGGGKAEKLFLIGCGLMFMTQIVIPFLSGLAWWLIHETRDESCPCFRTGRFIAYGCIGSGRNRVSCLCLLAEVQGKGKGPI